MLDSSGGSMIAQDYHTVARSSHSAWPVLVRFLWGPLSWDTLAVPPVFTSPHARSTVS
jgi:hypothetical protein